MSPLPIRCLSSLFLLQPNKSCRDSRSFFMNSSLIRHGSYCRPSLFNITFLLWTLAGITSRKVIGSQATTISWRSSVLNDTFSRLQIPAGWKWSFWNSCLYIYGDIAPWKLLLAREAADLTMYWDLMPSEAKDYTAVVEEYMVTKWN